jgi:hypothetical protein
VRACGRLHRDGDRHVAQLQVLGRPHDQPAGREVHPGLADCLLLRRRTLGHRLGELAAELPAELVADPAHQVGDPLGPRRPGTRLVPDLDVHPRLVDQPHGHRTATGAEVELDRLGRLETQSAHQTLF